LSNEISSLFPIERSVAIAVAVSLSLVDPKVTSEELGGLFYLAYTLVFEMTVVEVVPDLSID
jgi:hypothetical protein